MKKIISIIITVALVFGLAACGEQSNAPAEDTKVSDISKLFPDAAVLQLNSGKATLNGEALKEYDYTWSFDPSMEEPLYSGTEPAADSCYIAHDIVYYPAIDESSFVQQNYDGETEWVTHYTKEGLTDYLFSTLPVLGTELPSNMMHSAEEAYANPVLHITQPGEYILEGEWNGQIYIDLGDKDECFTDESKKVTLIMNGVDVNCTVAPSVVFYSLYECDNEWESRTTAVSSVDTSAAGARVVLVDGTENNFAGANVFRILKPKYKKEGSDVQKKYYKQDGGFYSYVSMEIEGNTGIMNITGSTFEGLDTELHLTVNGGYINIVSQDDGINVNEDHVSVFTLNDGRITIFAGQGAEGDVIDSNGYINIMGGVFAGASPSVADDMLDSEDGTFVADDAVVIENVAGIKGGMMGPGGMPGGPGNMQGEFGGPQGDPGNMPGEFGGPQGGPGNMQGGPGQMPPDQNSMQFRGMGEQPDSKPDAAPAAR